MAAILLDTTVLIDAQRGRPAGGRLLALRVRGDEPRVCVVNVEEVFRGLRPSEVGAANGLFRGLRITLLGREEGELAGSWRRDFARRGVTLSQADCLVAAAAVAVGGRLGDRQPETRPYA